MQTSKEELIESHQRKKTQPRFARGLPSIGSVARALQREGIQQSHIPRSVPSLLVLGVVAQSLEELLNLGHAELIAKKSMQQMFMMRACMYKLRDREPPFPGREW